MIESWSGDEASHHDDTRSKFVKVCEIDKIGPSEIGVDSYPATSGLSRHERFTANTLIYKDRLTSNVKKSRKNTSYCPIFIRLGLLAF